MRNYLFLLSLLCLSACDDGAATATQAGLQAQQAKHLQQQKQQLQQHIEQANQQSLRRLEPLAPQDK